MVSRNAEEAQISRDDKNVDSNTGILLVVGSDPLVVHVCKSAEEEAPVVAENNTHIHWE